jgi:hypothetical protein
MSDGVPEVGGPDAKHEQPNNCDGRPCGWGSPWAPCLQHGDAFALAPFSEPGRVEVKYTAGPQDQKGTKNPRKSGGFCISPDTSCPRKPLRAGVNGCQKWTRKVGCLGAGRVLIVPSPSPHRQPGRMFACSLSTAGSVCERIGPAVFSFFSLNRGLPPIRILPVRSCTWRPVRYRAKSRRPFLSSSFFSYRFHAPPVTILLRREKWRPVR